MLGWPTIGVYKVSLGWISDDVVGGSAGSISLLKRPPQNFCVLMICHRPPTEE